jgi:hypothetical protein
MAILRKSAEPDAAGRRRTPQRQPARPMPFDLRTILTALALFAGMLALMEVGARAGRKRMAEDPEGARAGTATAEGAVFALLGLLIAFTFSGAMARFEARRALIVEESNAIGTAWLRLDLLPEPARAELQQGLRDYLDARLSFYRALPDVPSARAALARVGELQEDLWSKTYAASRAEGSPAVMLLLPALNAMFDIASTRVAAMQNHPPSMVFVLLIAMALACALLAGFAMAPSRLVHWTHRLAFAGVVSFTVYAIQDLEHPRQGLLRVDHFDQVLVELRESMK